MKEIRKVIALSTLALTLSGGIAFAQSHRDDDNSRSNESRRNDESSHTRYVRHNEWRKGSRISRDDWNRGREVDYRHSHLHAPPRGYQWREVDGNYVLAAVATGVIASVIVAAAAH